MLDLSRSSRCYFLIRYARSDIEDPDPTLPSLVVLRGYPEQAPSMYYAWRV